MPQPDQPYTVMLPICSLVFPKNNFLFPRLSLSPLPFPYKTVYKLSVLTILGGVHLVLSCDAPRHVIVKMNAFVSFSPICLPAVSFLRRPGY